MTDIQDDLQDNLNDNLNDDGRSHPHHDHARLERFLLASLSVVLIYTLFAYVVLPAFWTHHEHQKGLAALPMVTLTAQGIPGDPINVGLVGDAKDVLCAMQAAGWYAKIEMKISKGTRWFCSVEEAEAAGCRETKR